MRGLVPNAITVIRFPLAAIFPAAGPSARLLIVAVAALSDWLDGHLARRTGQTTRLGEVLDPVADRLFVATALVTLTVEGTIPVWTLPLFLLRDIGATVGATVVLLRRHDARLPARRAGKRVTLLQLVGTALVLVRPGLAPVIAIVVACLGTLALRDYRRAAQSVVCVGEPRPGRRFTGDEGHPGGDPPVAESGPAVTPRLRNGRSPADSQSMSLPPKGADWDDHVLAPVTRSAIGILP